MNVVFVPSSRWRGHAVVSAHARARRQRFGDIVHGYAIDDAIGDAPVWPIADSKPPIYRDSIGAPRDSDRWHVGIDLRATAGAVVVAPEPGRVVAVQGFTGTTEAILIETDSGIVVLLGEIEPKSYRDFDVGVGARVERGQPVAVVGVNPGGSSMLHLETYTSGTRENVPWYRDQPPPRNVLDPTAYVRAAGASSPARKLPTRRPAPTPTMTPAPTTAPPAPRVPVPVPSAAPAAAGGGALVLVLLALWAFGKRRAFA